MKAVVIIVCICFPPLLTVVVVYCIVKMADHYEMLSLAVQDYLIDSYNFDIRRYHGVTEKEIQRAIKMLRDKEKEALKKDFNDNANSFFDEL